MVSFKAVIGKTPLSDIDISIQHSIEELIKRVNVVLLAYGKPVIVTSGFRSMHDHLRIYSEINSKRRKQNLPELKIPLSSKHLSGHAVDIADPGLVLTKWLKGPGDKLLASNGLYCEDGNSNWVHFQDAAPKSGSRWFLP